MCPVDCLPFRSMLLKNPSSKSTLEMIHTKLTEKTLSSKTLQLTEWADIVTYPHTGDLNIYERITSVRLARFTRVKYKKVSNGTHFVILAANGDDHLRGARIPPRHEPLRVSQIWNNKILNPTYSFLQFDQSSMMRSIGTSIGLDII